jgi:hypothetical protein
MELHRSTRSSGYLIHVPKEMIPTVDNRYQIKALRSSKTQDFYHYLRQAEVAIAR